MRSLGMGILAAALILPLFSKAQALGKDQLGVVFSCEEENDLYRAICNSGENWLRFDTPEKAIEYAPEGSGVAILAQNYPLEITLIDNDLLDRAAMKRLRLYIEFPCKIQGIQEVGIPQMAHWKRVVVTSDFFEEGAQEHENRAGLPKTGSWQSMTAISFRSITLSHTWCWPG